MSTKINKVNVEDFAKENPANFYMLILMNEDGEFVWANGAVERTDIMGFGNAKMLTSNNLVDEYYKAVEFLQSQDYQGTLTIVVLDA